MAVLLSESMYLKPIQLYIYVLYIIILTLCAVPRQYFGAAAGHAGAFIRVKIVLKCE